MPIRNPATRHSLGIDELDSPVFAGIDCDEIYNSDGNLKIMPDAQGDVGLFGDTDVANGADGRVFSINRRAAEGDTYLNLYINDDQVAYIDSNWDISIRSNLATGVIELGAIPTNIVRLIGTVNAIGEPSGTENLPLRHYGYITADAAQRYTNWLLDDTDDYFWLTRSDTNILGFKIDMPVNLVDNNLDTTGSISGVNVTSGVDPGHTHGSGSITEADPVYVAWYNSGAPTLVSITIGGNTINTSEWAYLDGQDQTVATTSTPTFAAALFTDKIKFTQTDGNEYIDSLNDGYVDYGATTGHRLLIGGTEQVNVIDGVLEPKTTNDIDLGTSSLLWKDIWEVGKHYFRDSAIYVTSTDDGWLNLVADIGVEINSLVLNVGSLDSTLDVIVETASNGLVLKDTQDPAHYWRVTVSILGALVTTDLGHTL